MDYRTMIGEKVVRYDGKFGIITEVDSFGYINIQYDGDSFGGSYMFDPFLEEELKFVDSEKQKEIDATIEKNDNEGKEIIKTFKAHSAEEETYFITIAKDVTPHHENGLPDKAIGLTCSRENAYRVFHYYIKQQLRNMRKVGNADGFHQVGLYDAKTNKKIAQET